MSSTPGYVKKIPGSTVDTKKTPGSSGSIKNISGIQRGIKKTTASPGSVSPLVQKQSSTSVASSISGTAQSPHPQSIKLSDGLSKPRTKSSPQLTNKFVSNRLMGTTKKLHVPSSEAVFHTPSNLSTGSSSSASSASSAKARKLINAVRRVSRMSSSSGTPNSKPS